VPAGASPTIIATVPNARGFSASHTFSVGVLNGPDCGSGTVARWDVTGSMLTPRYNATGVLLNTGRVLVAGGYNPTMLSSAELYSPETGTWSAAGNLSVARWGHTLTVLPSGRVLAVGGTTDTGGALESKAVDIYDPATNTWARAASMAFSRVRHTATLLPSGKVLVIGGASAEAGGSRIPELYDPATNSWVPVTAMAATSRSSHATVLLPSGRLLVAGGGAAAELYDPTTDSWSPATGLTGTGWSQAYLQPSGRVLLNSGLTFALYNPALNTQTSAGALVHSRTSTQVLLTSGKLLFTGGTSAGIGAIVEIYDPTTATTSFSVSMPSFRYGFAAVVLPSGKVLVAAGSDGSYLNTALLYTP
jgi:hypothetical protein